MFLNPGSTIFQRGALGVLRPSTDIDLVNTRSKIDSLPTKYRSHLISGNMHKLDGATYLIDEGGQTRVIHRSDAIPKVWIPAAIGKVFIEIEMREQFNEMRNEIIKRKRRFSPLSSNTTLKTSSARALLCCFPGWLQAERSVGLETGRSGHPALVDFSS